MSRIDDIEKRLEGILSQGDECDVCDARTARCPRCNRPTGFTEVEAAAAAAARRELLVLLDRQHEKLVELGWIIAPSVSARDG